MKTIKVETWLPVFPGFYNTIFEPQEENELEYIKDKREENNLTGEFDYDLVKFDYDQYYNDVAESCCNVIECELPANLITSILCQNVASPKEYNFRNDSINIEVKLTLRNMVNIRKYVNDNFDLFVKYLKNNYSSYSGFISFHSNNVNDWKITYDLLTDTHKLGAILQFICECEEINEEVLYYGGEFYLYAENMEELTTQHICAECGELIPLDNKCYIDSEKYTKLTGKLVNSVKCNECANVNVKI